VNRKFGTRALASAYMSAKAFVIEQGYADEVDWQENADFENVTESDLLQEVAWVVLNSGMRESVIRKHWGNISRSFYFWKSADRIVANRQSCIENAAMYFGNIRKLNAIVDIAEFVLHNGVDRTKYVIQHDPHRTIAEFPFIGKTTYFHLAKNLGIQTSKPDRHLVRLAEAHGYDSAESLCQDIAAETGEKVSLVDVVLWRICALGCDYSSLQPLRTAG